MSTQKIEKYYCDKCKKELSTWHNNLEIVTSLTDGSLWSRLHVKIEYHHGVGNDFKKDEADLCQECAVELLSDALNRVRKGERATAGVESPTKQTWGNR